MNIVRTIQVPISGTGSNVEIQAAIAGKRWICTYLDIATDSTSTSLTFRSGTTDITGPLEFTANERKTFGDGNGVVMAGRALNESFNVNLGTGAANLIGYAVLAFVDTQENFS